mmetsp:Transcript_28818/g.78078  ORF Transcript_28818/g.78078 Transcript_28818/m.78078 type:complete len:81 (-) Transcript_28818:29-271(-)
MEETKQPPVRLCEERLRFETTKKMISVATKRHVCCYRIPMCYTRREQQQCMNNGTSNCGSMLRLPKPRTSVNKNTTPVVK